MRIAALLISVLALVVVLYSAREQGLVETFRSVDPTPLLAALVLLLVNLGLAFLRFVVSFRVLGLSVQARDLPGPFFVGQVANLFPFGLVGQAAGRSAIMARLGVSASAVTFLSFAERIIALGSLSVFALAGVAVTFGQLHIDAQTAGNGPSALWVLVGLILTGIVVSIIVRRSIGAAFRDVVSRVSGPGLVSLLSISLVAHGAMLAAFWIVLRAFAPVSDVLPTLGALCIVMFASSLPISFAGWGLRELSSVQALGAVGVPENVSLATGLTIGALSTVIIFICIGGAAIFGTRKQQSDDFAQDEEQVRFDSAFVFLLGFAVALLLPFQLRVPLENYAVVVNLADVFAMAGLAVLAGDPGAIRAWRREWFVAPMLMITAALAISLVVGLLKHGPTSWALVNRGVGWLVILSYFVMNPILVRKGPEGSLSAIMQVSASAMACVAVAQLAMSTAGFVGIILPPDLQPIAVSGFSFNSNAYGLLCVFGLLIWMLGMAVEPQRPVTRFFRLAVPILLITSVMMTISRSSIMLAVVAAVCGMLIDRRYRRPLITALVVAVAVRGSFALFSEVLGHLIPSFGMLSLQEFAIRPDSDAERLESITGGLRLFAASPIFGAGLGGFIADRTKQGLSVLVIHSVPVWVLAEMGLVGLLLVGGAGALVTLALIRRFSSVYARIGLLTVTIFVGGGLAHDFFYQRIFWFALGLVAAALSLGDRTAKANLGDETASSRAEPTPAPAGR